MAGVKKQTRFFELPDKRVEVRYIRRQRGLVRDKNHVAYGGLMDGATVTFPAATQRNGNYANVLTKEEKEFLEKELSLDENGLSVYNKKGFWKDLKIRLTKEGIILDLSDPIDYIKYKTLLSYKDTIASSLKDIEPEYDKQSYRFVLVEEGEETKKKLSNLDVKKEAYKLLGKLEDDRQAMIDYFSVKGLKIAEGTSMEALKAKLGDEVETNPREFVKVLNDPSYHTKVLINLGVRFRIIIYKDGSYYLKENGEPLSKIGKATFQKAVEFLEDPENQATRLYIKEQIDNERPRI